MSHNIEKIIFINLDKRIDRRLEIEKELTDMGLEYERFAGIVHPASGSVGCSLSHLGVLKLAKERNYKNVLILEDDFTFKVKKDFFESELSRFFNSKIDYHVLMLAYNIPDKEKMTMCIKDEPNFYRVLKAHTASCYMVNSNYFDVLIDLYEWSSIQLIETGQHWNFTNDQACNVQSKDKWFCTSTKIGVQRPGFSDNTLRMHDNNDT
jgi:glycosyl transferase family 25